MGKPLERLEFWGLELSSGDWEVCGGSTGGSPRFPVETVQISPFLRQKTSAHPKQQAWMGSCGDFDDSMPTSVTKGKWPGPVVSIK